MKAKKQTAAASKLVGPDFVVAVFFVPRPKQGGRGRGTPLPVYTPPSASRLVVCAAGGGVLKSPEFTRCEAMRSEAM